MKKILSFVLTLFILIANNSIFASATQPISKIISLGKPRIDNIDVYVNNYIYEGENYVLNVEQEDKEFISELFSDSGLEYNDEESDKYIQSETKSSDLSCPDIYYEYDSSLIIFYFDKEHVIAEIHNYIKNSISAGVFNYNNKSDYNKLIELLDGYAEKQKQLIEESKPDYTELEDYEYWVYDFELLYEAEFITEYGQKYYWGFCRYSLAEEGSETINAAYISGSGMNRSGGGIGYLSDEISDGNVIHFSGEKTLSYYSGHESNKIAEHSDSNEQWTYKWVELDFDIGENNKIDSLEMKYLRASAAISNSETVDLSDYDDGKSGEFPVISGFDVTSPENIREEADSADNTADIGNEQAENTKADDKQTSSANTGDSVEATLSSSDGKLMPKILADGVTLFSIWYSYDANGDKVNISKTWHELEDDEIYDDVKKIWNKATFTYTDNISDKSTSDLRIDFSKGNEYRIYAEIFDGYVKVYDSETEKNPEYYTYSGSDLPEEYREIFTQYIRDELENFIKYEDISDFNPKYRYSFEITLPDKLENSWIDEVSENGKVKITVFHESNSDISHITLEGNGKSYSLMRSYDLPIEYTNGRTPVAAFTTDNIGIEKDTPIPYHFEEGGAIRLSWSECTQYTARDELTVDIYTKNDASKRISEVNVDVESPTGEGIKVVKLTDALTEDDLLETPVEPKAERGLVFTDVPENHWAHRDIENFYYATIVNGVGNGLFAPDDTITYEHFGFLLDRLFGYKYENTKQTPAIRQDVIAALIKACGLGEADMSNSQILDKFSDKELLTEENALYVRKAVEEGLVIGYGGALNADGNLTRAETVTLLYRAIKKVYGISDSDIPESYKLKIIPQNSKYLSVHGYEPYKFVIKNPDTKNTENPYLVHITNETRLGGELLITFGDDVYNDTNIYAVCIADDNYYVIDSTSVYSAEFNISKRLDFYMNVYKNGKLIIENGKARLYYSTEDDDVEFHGDNASLYFFSAKATNGRLPVIPEIPDNGESEYYEKFYDGKEITGSGTLENAKGDAMISDMYTLSSGFMKIAYSPDWSAIDVSEIRITAKSITLGNSEYIIEPAEITSYSSSEARGTFNIIRDGEVIAENISGEITGINSGLGEYMTFSTVDGVWGFEIQISEIEN